MQPERHPGSSPRRRPALVTIVGVVAILALGGCATPGGDAARGALTRGGSADRAVATELTAVLARIHPPLETTVQINRTANDPSLERVVDALVERGFGIQRVSADQGAHYLSFSRDVRPAIDGGVALITWRLAVGELEARRAYALDRDGRLLAAGPLALTGTTVAVGADALADSPIALALPAHGRVIEVEAPNVAEPSAPADPWVAVAPVAEAPDATTGATTLGKSAHRALDAFASGGASPPRDDGRTPRLAVDFDVLAAIGLPERRRLHLVATDLVGALAQIPELRPASATFQIAPPRSPFGHAVLRALEDAGFGLQRVSADQGRRYVSYAHRHGETDAGPVEDFSVSVGGVRLTRGYATEDDRVYPSSALSVSGTDHADEIVLADELFTEQGGRIDFVSGARDADAPLDAAEPRIVQVRADDALPLERRTRTRALLDEARRHYLRADSARAVPALDRFTREAREVLLFDDARSARLGEDNKRAVRLFSRTRRDGDLVVVRACHDTDGVDDGALARGVRLEEELMGYGVPPEAVWIAPCVRAGYRSASSGVAPAELMLYRPKD